MLAFGTIYIICIQNLQYDRNFGGRLKVRFRSILVIFHLVKSSEQKLKCKLLIIILTWDFQILMDPKEKDEKFIDFLMNRNEDEEVKSDYKKFDPVTLRLNNKVGGLLIFSTMFRKNSKNWWQTRNYQTNSIWSLGSLTSRHRRKMRAELFSNSWWNCQDASR